MASTTEVRPPAGEAQHRQGAVPPPALPRPRPGTARAWTGGLVTLGVASAVLFWAFRAEIAAAVYVWANSAAFGHAFFIVPVSLFLFYRARHRLAALQPEPAPWVLLPIAALCLLWMVGALANLMVIKQLVFVALWQALFVLVLGRRVALASLFPLAYLYFAVPFGSAIIPALQDVTAQMVVYLLRLVGMPVFVNGYFIQIPSGSFLVAEACSGVRYLLVSVALGVLAAHLFFRSWPRRLFFVALSVVVPIVANGVRAYGIVMLAHLTDYRLAVDVDHVIYGFVFLAIVTMILLGLAALLRDRHGPGEDGPPALAAGLQPPVGQGRPTRRSVVQAVCASIAVAIPLLAQGWVAAAQQAPAGPTATPALPPAVAPWQPAGSDTFGWTPRFHGSDRVLRGSYRLGDERVDLHVAYYAYQREQAEAISDLNATLGSGREWNALDVGRAEVEVAGRRHPYVRMLLSKGNDNYVVWYWYWIDGRSTNSQILGKLLEVKTAMISGDPRAAMIAIAARVSEDAQRTEALLNDFLARTLDSDGRLIRFDKSGNGYPNADP